MRTQVEFEERLLFLSEQLTYVGEQTKALETDSCCDFNRKVKAEFLRREYNSLVQSYEKAYTGYVRVCAKSGATPMQKKEYLLK